MSLLPVFLKLDGRPALVVGAGEVAAGKIESLVSAGASVTVIATYARPEIVSLAEQRRITWHRRKFRDADIKGQFVIVAGTNFREVNQRVYKLARQANILTNAVDDPPNCDFYYGSVVSRGEDLQIAISTNGESPAFAQRLRKEIDALLPDDADTWLHAMGELRREILIAQPSGDDRKHLLQRLAQFPVCASPICPARLEAFPPARQKALGASLAVSVATLLGGAALLSAVLAQRIKPARTRNRRPFYVTQPSGKVFLIGAGPGDPDLLTVKAARLLGSVDVVLHDDLVTAAVLALANRNAHVVNVGKRCGRKSITQPAIHRLMINYARQGQCVARLKSGDPLVFGRAGEEISALTEAGIEYEIVPGITAAFAAAAALGCSFTDRRSASSILFSSGHHATANKDTTEPTRVVYMPGRDFSSLAVEWLTSGLPQALPCVLISHAGQTDQEITRTTLGALASTRPGPAPVLLIAGWAVEAPLSDLAPYLPTSSDLISRTDVSKSMAK